MSTDTTLIEEKLKENNEMFCTPDTVLIEETIRKKLEKTI